VALKRSLLPTLTLTLTLVLLAAPLLAAEDEVVGTFTVHGKTTTFKHVYASRQADPDTPGVDDLVLLLSDVPLPEADRSSSRLLGLASNGRVHALKLRWREGSDDIAAVPYHAAIPQSGSTVHHLGMIDLQELTDEKIAVRTESHKLGQDWHYSARLRAALHRGGTAEIEPEADAVATSDKPLAGEAGDPLFALKKELGRQGYEYNAENFVTAVKDGQLEAVKLFLQGGMSANTKAGDQHAMIMAATLCASDPQEARGPVILALLAAKGDPNARDETNATALLRAVQMGCDPEVIRAMIKAGADVNARAKGGGTPLMLAKALNRAEIAEILRAAGAKP
jgi:hypothetical protein